MSHYDIFISHSSKDAGRVRWLVEALEAGGLRCWIAPRDIAPGVAYARAIMRGIDGCATFIVAITANSVASEDVLNEIDNAHAQHKRIIPVFLDDIELPREFNYYLSRTQWVRLSEKDAANAVSLLGLSAPADVPQPGQQPVAAVKVAGGPATPTLPTWLMKAGMVLSAVTAIVGISGKVKGELAGLLLVYLAFAYMVVMVLALFMPRSFGCESRKAALLWYGLPFVLWFLGGSFILPE